MALVIYHVDTAEHGDIEVEVSGGSVYMTGEGKPRDAEDHGACHMEYLHRKLTAMEALRLGTSLVDCGMALLDSQEENDDGKT